MAEDALEILQRVPELKEIAETYKEMCEEDRETLRETLQILLKKLEERPAAYLPDEVYDRMAHTISHTKMAAPDMSNQAESFANKVADYLRPAMEEAAHNAVSGKKFPVVVEHVMKGELWTYASEAARKHIIILYAVIGILVAGFTTAGIVYFNSWVHWGYRLERVCEDSRQDNPHLKGREDVFLVARQQFKAGKEEKEKFKQIVRECEVELEGLPPVPVE